jgi:hypothetical protein
MGQCRCGLQHKQQQQQQQQLYICYDLAHSTVQHGGIKTRCSNAGVAAAATTPAAAAAAASHKHPCDDLSKFTMMVMASAQANASCHSHNSSTIASCTSM